MRASIIHDHVGPAGGDDLQPFGRVGGRQQDVVGVAEGPAEGMQDGSLVVDHQNGRHVGPRKEILSRSPN
jgi:hypothetical protein